LIEIPESEKQGINPKGPYKLFRAPGCKYCQNKGSKGRIGVFEIIEMTPQLEEIIVTGAADSKFRDEAKRQGMTTMFQDAILKTLRGQISFEEVLRITKE
jgi:type IV pilus assembly protein PilB